MSRDNRHFARRRLLAIAIPVLVLFVAFLATYQVAYSRYAASQTAATSQAMASFAASMDSLLARHESLPRVLALDHRVADVLTQATPDAVRQANLYLETVTQLGSLQAAYVIDSKGDTLAASNWNQPISFVGKNYTFRPYFRDAMAFGFGHLYALGSTSHEPGYYLAAAVHRGEAIVGVVVVKVDLRVLEQLLHDPREIIAVVDEFGVVVLSAEPSWIYRPLQPLSAQAADVLKSTGRYGSQPLTPLQAAGSSDGLPHSMELQLHGGTKKFSVATRAAGILGWRVVSLSDLSAARAVALAVALAVSTALAFVIALLTYEWLRRKRADELIESVEKVSRSEARVRAVADNLPVMVCFITRELRYEFANAMYAQMYGKHASALSGCDVRSVIGPEEYGTIEPYLKRALAGETVAFQREHLHARAYRYFEATYRPEWDSHRLQVVGIHSMTQEITERKRTLDDLARLSQLDHLTQLLNRKGFEARLAAAVQMAEADGSMLALLCVDLDDFKPVNDKFGHQVGDAVLRAFSDRLSRAVRASDAVARLGGDEFAVVLSNIGTVGIAEQLAAAILRLTEAPFNVEGVTVAIGASVGVVYQCGAGLRDSELCKKADDCLYEAKREGKRSYRVAPAAVIAAEASTERNAGGSVDAQADKAREGEQSNAVTRQFRRTLS